jgi:surface polysaccharide O-acyltransferase-like enzyme
VKTKNFVTSIPEVARPEVKQRSYTVDNFRLLGALTVIILHTIHIQDVPQAIFFGIKNLTRWAVPFFFLVSGFYFEKAYRSDPGIALTKRLKNLIGIFLSVNIIYFFFSLYEGTPLTANFSISTLILGFYHHLWFIGAMIFGYLFMWFVLEQKPSAKTLLTLIVASLLFVLFTGSYARVLGFFEPNNAYSRTLIAIPFLLTGFCFARYNLLNRINLPVAFIITAFGISLQLAEPFVLYYTIKNFSPVGNDLLFGTVFFSIGMFLLAMKINNPKDTLTTKLGRDYSLLLYLYHPLIMGLLPWAALSGHYSFSWLKPAIVFTICTLLIVFLDRKAPPVYRFINGSSWK